MNDETERLRAELADGRTQYANLRKAFDDTVAILAATATERDAFKSASGRVRDELTAALAIWEPEHEHHRDRAERKGYSHDEAAATVYGAAIKVVTRAIAALAAPEAPGEQER